ncbi:prepilin-type N-terminal cleavage/methylation domain-containing protein [Marinicella rhabdoformis]|uniref:prepilin-type N-terminal cleavage/methylation domain-containing protein n=1 Tax=Marinicella rhabdoformis TaxID=2580566 RepID=UPI0012AEB468|nr:prepilin-type N-terminal cleavage/methylation domain-containing protein [Marinicella rhabdoformis]
MSAELKKTSGFTLLELLLVVVILAVLTATGVQLLGGQSYENRMKDQSQDLIKQLHYMCEKAVFENRPFAMAFSQNAHQLLTYRKQQWFVVNDKQWPYKALDEDFMWELFIAGKPQKMANELAAEPHVICYNTGQITAFELLLKADSASDSTSQYQITSAQPNQIKAGWLDES